MIECVITFKTGETQTIHARDWIELFNTIGSRDIARIDAYEVGVRGIRQGRVKACV